jgi:hypothetical protein
VLSLNLLISVLPQVIKKRRIVLASVLKPVDETRMLEKLGVTLSDSGEYEVTIIGYPSTSRTSHPTIRFNPLPAFTRLSFKRLLIPWIIFKKINQVKPELIIINTPELLLVAILNRIFFGRKIIYDVLENYYRNIRFTSAFPAAIRWALAPLVRLKEWMSSPFIHHFFLAEAGYQKELRFANPYTILENKLPQTLTDQSRQSRGYSKLIFTGTLAHSTGIFEAIQLTKELHQADSTFSLTVIGYCAQPEVLHELKKAIEVPFIKLIGGDRLVPHEQILKEIDQADVGIIHYPANPSTQSSIPTKLYEYLAMRLPVLIRHNEASHELVKNCHAGIVLSVQPDVQSLATKLKSDRFTPTPPPSVFWEPEGEKLIYSLKKL